MYSPLFEFQEDHKIFNISSLVKSDSNHFSNN